VQSLKSSKEKESTAFNNQIRRLEQQIHFLRSELDVVNKFLKENGLSVPIPSPPNIKMNSLKARTGYKLDPSGPLGSHPEEPKDINPVLTLLELQKVLFQ